MYSAAQAHQPSPIQVQREDEDEDGKEWPFSWVNSTPHQDKYGKRSLCIRSIYYSNMSDGISQKKKN